VQSVVRTPGQWSIGIVEKSYDDVFPQGALAVFADAEYRQHCALKGNAAVICVVAPADRTTPEDVANAKQIADAPELLDVLRELHDFSQPLRQRQYEERSQKAFRDAAILLNSHDG
jgi:hypothetical protein